LIKILNFSFLLVCFLTAISLEASPKKLLSDYNFFKKIETQIPNENVIPYHLASPLFSDYTYKFRFVSMPNGEFAQYNYNEVFNFPVGTKIIKTFAYPVDDRDLSLGFQLLETRLLIKDQNGWYPLSYIWKENQDDAELKYIGKTINAKWIDKNGVEQVNRYRVPNINQCGSCHNLNKVIMPIGPKGRNLDVDFFYQHGMENQIDYWDKINILENIPSDRKNPTAIWNLESETIENRARAYLDINCAHCHREGGSAGNSGFYLSHEETNNTSLGIMKKPVAAGRGSGGLKYVIKPGISEESILLYRMASTDPGVMMPELSRNMEHKEAIPLIKEWIDSIN
tara:strand:+ start:2587 stop:3606 length:1020 start_codon:yes stop_codon:yes gene_type:complete